MTFVAPGRKVASPPPPHCILDQTYGVLCRAGLPPPWMVLPIVATLPPVCLPRCHYHSATPRLPEPAVRGLCPLALPSFHLSPPCSSRRPGAKAYSWSLRSCRHWSLQRPPSCCAPWTPGIPTWCVALRYAARTALPSLTCLRALQAFCRKAGVRCGGLALPGAAQLFVP
jgi:hypothetical protein